jgi:hypothetical protein
MCQLGMARWGIVHLRLPAVIVGAYEFGIFEGDARSHDEPAREDAAMAPPVGCKLSHFFTPPWVHTRPEAAAI